MVDEHHGRCARAAECERHRMHVEPQIRHFALLLHPRVRAVTGEVRAPPAQDIAHTAGDLSSADDAGRSCGVPEVQIVLADACVQRARQAPARPR